MNKTQSIHSIARRGNLTEFESQFNRSTINDISEVGYSLLHDAIAGGNYETAIFLIENGINLALKDPEGQTALHYIPWHFKGFKNNEEPLSIAKLILKKIDKESLNSRDAVYWNTPLMTSIIKLQSYELVELILEAGADPLIPNINNLNAIQFLDIRNNTRLKEIFSKYG
jgi:ankyrin repeat protein